MDIWTINIVAPTVDNDRYDRVAINESPIVILGRESDVKNALNGEMKSFIKSKFSNQELWEKATYCGKHLKRIEGFWESEGFEWKAADCTDLEFD